MDIRNTGLQVEEVIRKHHHVCWYPSAGVDFRPLLYLSEKFYDRLSGKSVEQFSIPVYSCAERIIPDLFVMTDTNLPEQFLLSESDRRKRKTLFSDGRRTNIEVIGRPEKCIDAEAFFMRVKVTSDWIGEKNEWIARLLYVRMDNMIFAKQYLLSKKLHVETVINIRMELITVDCVKIQKLFSALNTMYYIAEQRYVDFLQEDQIESLIYCIPSKIWSGRLSDEKILWFKLRQVWEGQESEIEIETEALSEPASGLPDRLEDAITRESLVRYLREKMEDNISILRHALMIPEERALFSRSVHRLDYRRTEGIAGVGPQAEDYSDRIFDAYYLNTYGYAYAFEYYVIYDAILRSYTGTERQETPILGVVSIGSGTMLDAWSLAYAKAFIEETAEGSILPEGLTLRYCGYDYTKWATFFAGDNEQASPVNHCFYNQNGNSVIPKIRTGEEQDIVEIFRRFDWPLQYYNVMMFSKILNELPAEKLDQLIEAVRQAAIAGKFRRKELYICISHSITSQENDAGYAEIAQRIVEAINYNNSFEVDGSIMERSPLFEFRNENNKLTGIVLSGNEPHDEYHKFYRFYRAFGSGDNLYGTYVETLNPDFASENVRNFFDQNKENLERLASGPNNAYKRTMRNTKYFSMQVIKLR